MKVLKYLFMTRNCKKYQKLMEHPLLSFRTRGLQPFHLSSAAGVHRHGSGLHVPALRQCDLGQGVHRQADQPVQVLWLRLVRQSGLGPERDSQENGKNAAPNCERERECASASNISYSPGQNALASIAKRAGDIAKADAASLLDGRGKCNIGNRFSHTEKFQPKK